MTGLLRQASGWTEPLFSFKRQNSLAMGLVFRVTTMGSALHKRCR